MTKMVLAIDTVCLNSNLCTNIKGDRGLKDEILGIFNAAAPCVVMQSQTPHPLESELVFALQKAQVCLDSGQIPLINKSVVT